MHVEHRVSHQRPRPVTRLPGSTWMSAGLWVAELLRFDVRSMAESRSKLVADAVVPGVARVSDGCRHAG